MSKCDVRAPVLALCPALMPCERIHMDQSDAGRVRVYSHDRPLVSDRSSRSATARRRGDARRAENQSRKRRENIPGAVASHARGGRTFLERWPITHEEREHS
eukprot:181752-Pyramimonas_sp.AAC.2